MRIILRDAMGYKLTGYLTTTTTPNKQDLTIKNT